MGRPDAAHVAGRTAVLPRVNPFTLGVASGDPFPESVVLWTRLLPFPDELDIGRLLPDPVEVAWQVATDPAMRSIERSGSTWAIPEHAHAVHVAVDGLRPGREYWYRFRSGRWLSPVGRTKTAPPFGKAHDRLEIVAASCQSWSAGYYTAHRHLADDLPDVVVFLGDYIYEYGIDSTDNGRAVDVAVPPHLATETKTLDRYRAQHAWYKRDPDLQAAHQAAPWIATWDDHEVEDNYADEVASRPTPQAEFRARRAAAYQAYWEHMPLRVPPPSGAAMRIHRRVEFGSLATLHVLDTRQHRSDQIAGDAWQRPKPERADPQRTMLGEEQQRWLGRGLAASGTRWNVVAQQVIASRLDVGTGDELLLNADTWDGYPAAQQDLYDALRTTTNPVVLTGDLHAAYAFEIVDPRAGAEAGPIGVELATTSISSGGDGSDLSSTGRRFLAANPHLHYACQRRGYFRCRFTPDEMAVDFRTVPYVVGASDAPVSTDRSFVVEYGRPRLLDP